MKATFLLSLLLTASALADDFTKTFTALRKKNDKEAIEKFLQESATKEKNNPNYYATAGNYWWSTAGKKGLQITALPEGNFNIDPNDLSITDPKTGKKVGKIGPVPKGRTEAGKKALEILSTGAEKFPQRADIALGLAHLQKESQLTKGYTDTLVALLAQAKKSPMSLKWMNNEKLPGPANKFLPEEIQTYSLALFRTDSPATDKLCATLLDTVIDTYPDHPYAYNLKAALADANGKPKEALKLLITAYKKSPSDPLILSNLAEKYAKQNLKPQAIKAYEKLLTLKLTPAQKSKAQAALKKIQDE